MTPPPYAQPEPLLALGKRGPEEPVDHELGRSRGGLTIKIHMICDANGVPLRFVLSPGQASDISNAEALLDQVRLPGKSGRPRKRYRWLLADKGCDAEHLRQYCDRYRMRPVIPLRTMKRKPKPGLPRLFDRPKYRQRNIIKRMFGWLKESRRIGTRYDKLAKVSLRWSRSLARCAVDASIFRTEPKSSATWPSRQNFLRQSQGTAQSRSHEAPPASSRARYCGSPVAFGILVIRLRSSGKATLHPE